MPAMSAVLCMTDMHPCTPCRRSGNHGLYLPTWLRLKWAPLKTYHGPCETLQAPGFRFRLKTRLADRTEDPLTQGNSKLKLRAEAAVRAQRERAAANA